MGILGGVKRKTSRAASNGPKQQWPQPQELESDTLEEGEGVLKKSRCFFGLRSGHEIALSLIVLR